MATTQYGFEWGQVTVERCMEQYGTKVILIKTEAHTLEVAVSPKGQSIRAWLDHERLTSKES